MRYLVTILALVPSIAHAYFNSILNESTIYQNKIITNNYQKYAAVTLITDEQGGLQSHSVSTPKCDKDEELYQGKCQSIECRDKYPFTLPPDTNKGYVVSYICLGIKRFAYSSCREDIGWIAEMNKYNRIQDCVERPGKEEYPLYPKDVVNIKDYAKTDCKYFGGVERCRINSCDDGWDAKRNSAGKIIKCEIHTCSSEYYINSKPDESIGALLPPCKAGHVTFYGYKTCNKGYSGPVKGQCKLKTCSASDGYVYTTGPITGCKSGETCYSGSSTYHRCTEVNTGYCMDADGFVNPCQCGAGYVYNAIPIKGCKLASEVCYSGDKTLYECLEPEDGYVIDDNRNVNPNSCEGYTHETPDIPDCLEVSEACLSGDKQLYKCLKLKTCDGFSEDKPVCLGDLDTCTVGGKTYYKCPPTTPTIEYPCENIQNEYDYFIPEGCYRQLIDPTTKTPIECDFIAKVGCPAVVNNNIIGTIVAINPKDKNGNELYEGILVAGLDTIDYTGKPTTEPITWSTQKTAYTSTRIMPTLTDVGSVNTSNLGPLYTNSIIQVIYNYVPKGCVDEDYCSINAWYLPSKYELQLAKEVPLLTPIVKPKTLLRKPGTTTASDWDPDEITAQPIYPDNDEVTDDQSGSELSGSSPKIYMTSTIEEGNKLANTYMSVGYGYGEDSEPTITKIATYEQQACDSDNDCVRKAYARPFVILPLTAMSAFPPSKDQPIDNDNSSDDNTTPSSGGGGGGGRGNELVVDGPNTDVDTNQKYDGNVVGPEHFHRAEF